MGCNIANWPVDNTVLGRNASVIQESADDSGWEEVCEVHLGEVSTTVQLGDKDTQTYQQIQSKRELEHRNSMFQSLVELVLSAAEGKVKYVLELYWLK